MACSHRIVIGCWLLFAFGILQPEDLFASEAHSVEENAIQIENKEVEALRIKNLKLSNWKSETGEKIKEEWQRTRLLQREFVMLEAPSQLDYLDNQDRALAGKDFLAVRYLHKDQPVASLKKQCGSSSTIKERN